jgi:replication factor C subunit 1
MADAAAGKSTDKSAAKRKLQKGNNELKDDSKPLPAKKMAKDDEDDDGDDDFVAPSKKKTPVKPPPSKKPKVESNVEAPGRTTGTDDGEEEDKMDEDAKTPSKGAGRGRGMGGRGAAATPGGRGRGGGGRGFMNFGERKDPPHKGEKVSLVSLFSGKLKSSIINCLFHLVHFAGGSRGCT